LDDHSQRGGDKVNQQDVVEVGGYTFNIPGFSKLRPKYQTGLRIMIEVTLQRGFPPSIRELLQALIDDGTTGLRSMSSIQAGQRVVDALVRNGHLRPEDNFLYLGRRMYWPIVLKPPKIKVRPREKYLVQEAPQEQEVPPTA
jgi:hypothetical protein